MKRRQPKTDEVPQHRPTYGEPIEATAARLAKARGLFQTKGSRKGGKLGSRAPHAGQRRTSAFPPQTSSSTETRSR